ncbi:MAG: ribose-phosphate diphosphokinase [Roseivirga sp.]
MKYLNLNPGFSPFGKGIAFKQFTFPGGEPHVKIEETFSVTDELMITHRVNSFNDIGLILLAVDALRRMSLRHISLFIPYFPGARQDRLMTSGEPFTLKVYASLINSLNLESVMIFDPHSDVAPALIGNVRVVSNHGFVRQAISGLADYHLIAPDSGALKKVYALADDLETDSVIACGKIRNVGTGTLSGFEVYAEDLQGKTCVVVDDICDGGGTFLGIAKELKRKNAGKLILLVSHGIFSNGIQQLKECYDEIICTDAFRTIINKDVEQIQLNTNLLK